MGGRKEGLMRSYIGGWEGRQCRIASTKVACSRLEKRCAPTLCEPHSRQNGIRQTGVAVSACFATLLEGWQAAGVVVVEQAVCWRRHRQLSLQNVRTSKQARHSRAPGFSGEV